MNYKKNLHILRAAIVIIKIKFFPDRIENNFLCRVTITLKNVCSLQIKEEDDNDIIIVTNQFPFN